MLEYHAVLWSIVALLAGTLIYSLHRGLTNLIFEFVRHYLLTPPSIRSFVMPKRVKILLLKRW